MESHPEECRWSVVFSGRVQGVGFRYTVQEISRRYSVTGWVRNRDDGRVEMVAEGTPKILKRFLDDILNARQAYIADHHVSESTAIGAFNQFQIRR